MRLAASQLDADSLAELGRSAVELLRARSYDALTKMMPYALAFDRRDAFALEADLIECLPAGDALAAAQPAEISVKYFSQNDIPLFALVECRLPTCGGSVVLFELIVRGQEHKIISVEQVSLESEEST